MESKIVVATGIARSTWQRRANRTVRHWLARKVLRISKMISNSKWFQGVMFHWLVTRGVLSFSGATASNSAETSILSIIFTATTWANVAINATSSPLTNLYVSLHTADPGEAGDQTTSEAAYASYARVAVARTSGGWTVSGNAVVPVANISFPASTGSGSTITHFGIGSLTSTAGVLYFSGTVTPNIAIGAAGITPVLDTTTTVTID